MQNLSDALLWFWSGTMIGLLILNAWAGMDVAPAPPVDMSAYAKKTDLTATSDALTAAMGAAGKKVTAIPTAGPGAGLCKISVVPSELVTSGGVVGTAGTCTRIVQCGTDAGYVVVQFNIGGGC